jgi:hypothetical protein
MNFAILAASAALLGAAPAPTPASEAPVVAVQYNYERYDLPPAIRYGCSYPPCFRGPPPRRRWHGYPGYPGYYRGRPAPRYY